MEADMSVVMKVVIILLLLVSSVAADGIFNHSKFNKLLEEYVSDDGKIDYDKFAGSKEFETYIEELGRVNLSGFNNDEKLAFYINAYNASVIKNVLKYYPIKSPMDVEGFFKKNKFNIAGEQLTLDEIEYERIEKIEHSLMHFGLVCAAVSCPKLLPKAYRAETVYERLKKNAKEFLSDTTKNIIDEKNKILILSEIFKWFKSSFEKKYGTLNKAAAALLGENDLTKFDNYSIEYMKYNWQLNVK
jgi:hypothetical protein